MPKISLNTNYSLETAYNALRVRRSLANLNSLETHSDGLYAKQQAATGSGGYPDKYRSSQGGIVSGVDYPYKDELTNDYNKRLVAPMITHRVFTCEYEDGHDISLRECDRIFPGDMYRVLDTANGVYKYYLVLKTDGTHVLWDQDQNPPLLASVPVNAPCN